MATLLDRCRAKKTALGYLWQVGDFDSLEAPNAADYGIIVVPMSRVRGYNSAVRLGVMVTGVYPSNNADRQQLRGRLYRIGQTRQTVEYVTVVMENSVLSLLRQRHESVGMIGKSIEQVYKKIIDTVDDGAASRV